MYALLIYWVVQSVVLNLSYVDPAFGQEILDVALRQRVPHVHHYNQTDHFWRAVEISERVDHPIKFRAESDHPVSCS